VHLFVGHFDVTGAKAIMLVLERALQHQCQLCATVAMVRHRSASRDFEEPDGCALCCWQNRLADAAANLAPFHGVQIARDVVLQWGRENTARADWRLRAVVVGVRPSGGV